LSDSRRVIFKIIEASETYESDILSYLRLSDSSVHRDPRNKAIPVLEILKLSEEREIAVTELWSPYWSRPSVNTWAEFADFMHQVLEVRNMRHLVPNSIAYGVVNTRASLISMTITLPISIFLTETFSLGLSLPSSPRQTRSRRVVLLSSILSSLSSIHCLILARSNALGTLRRMSHQKCPTLSGMILSKSTYGKWAHC
jgi:hypothetical protein